MPKSYPEWFNISEEVSHEVCKYVGPAIDDCNLPAEYKFFPVQAYWFFINTLSIAHQANLDGLHANALANTRFCIECLSIIELGLCRVDGRIEQIESWKKGEASPGQLRKWSSQNLWEAYGKGLWDESWSDFAGQLARAVQPYSHYTEALAQWQSKLHIFDVSSSKAVIELGARVYDPQKASRITLYHSLLWHYLARVYLGCGGKHNPAFYDLIDKHRRALGASRFLDGHRTSWDQQFWAMLWDAKTGEPFHE